MMRRATPILIFATLLPLCTAAERQPTSPPASTPPGDIQLQVVKVPQFLEAIQKHKGNVVVVYFWAGYDLVSWHGFSRVVDLQKKYASDGLVVVSASIASQDKDRKKNLVEVLREKHARFENFILDEDMEAISNLQSGDFVEPAFTIYDHTGKMRRVISPGDFQDFFRETDRLIGKLIADLKTAQRK